MSLHRLEVFVCVAKHRQITRAAGELHISQPSVSRHLKLLEDEFGAALHRKVSGGIELTPAGEEFLRGAHAVLSQYEQLKSAVANDRTARRHLKIGSSFAPSVAFLPSLLVSFGRANPEFGIVTRSGSSKELEQLVLAGEIDIAFITRPTNSDGKDTTLSEAAEIFLTLFRRRNGLKRRKPEGLRPGL